MPDLHIKIAPPPLKTLLIFILLIVMSKLTIKIKDSNEQSQQKQIHDEEEIQNFNSDRIQSDKLDKKQLQVLKQQQQQQQVGNVNINENDDGDGKKQSNYKKQQKQFNGQDRINQNIEIDNNKDKSQQNIQNAHFILNQVQQNDQKLQGKHNKQEQQKKQDKAIQEPSIIQLNKDNNIKNKNIQDQDEQQQRSSKDKYPQQEQEQDNQQGEGSRTSQRQGQAKTIQNQIRDNRKQLQQQKIEEQFKQKQRIKNNKKDKMIDKDQSQNSNNKNQPKRTFKQKSLTFVSSLKQFFSNLPITSQQTKSLLQNLPIELIDTIQRHFYAYVDKFTQYLFPILRSYYRLYKILNDQTKPKPKKIYYPINYANLHGGAKIIMKSSQDIKSVNSILQDGLDKYMYTDQQLPIKIIIGLNQQIAIQSVIIQSYEMYSCITKQFQVQGKFALQDKKWVYLGSYIAENKFGDQQFSTERKIIRYIKLTIFSKYGKYSYFTLTQIKIRGKGLFADALSDKNKQNSFQSQDKQKIPQQYQQQQSQNNKQIEQRPRNICQNTFLPKQQSQEPHESNLIAVLISKVNNLQETNIKQGNLIELLGTKLINMTTNLQNKIQENKFYERVLEEYKKQAKYNYYVILFSLVLSAMTLLCLVCLCLIRRKQLVQGRLRGTGFQVKKKLSN